MLNIQEIELLRTTSQNLINKIIRKFPCSARCSKKASIPGQNSDPDKGKFIGGSDSDTLILNGFWMPANLEIRFDGDVEF